MSCDWLSHLILHAWGWTSSYTRPTKGLCICYSNCTLLHFSLAVCVYVTIYIYNHLFLLCLLLVLIFCRMALSNIVCLPIKELTCLLKFLCAVIHFTVGNMVTFLLIIILGPFIFTTPLFFVLCRIGFKHNRYRGRLFVNKGGWWRHDTHAYDHNWCMAWKRSPASVSKSWRPKANSVRVTKVEAQTTQIRAHLRIQE